MITDYKLVFTDYAQWVDLRQYVQQSVDDSGWSNLDGYEVDEIGANITPATYDEEGSQLTGEVIKEGWLVNVRCIDCDLPQEILSVCEIVEPENPKREWFNG